MLTILNALPPVCAESSIASMQVGFVMTLDGVPVKELFNDVLDIGGERYTASQFLR